MSTRKPRSDAHLKTLPLDRQQDIADYARDHSLQEIKAWLSEDGVITSVGALSQFLSWHSLKSQLAQNESTVESVLAQLKETRPELTEEELFAAGQAFFSAMAIETRDAKTWKRTQDLKFKRELMALEREKFQRDTCDLFLKWYSDEQARTIAGSTQTNSEKIERLGKLMFGEEWK
jgi:hypothetical protein